MARALRNIIAQLAAEQMLPSLIERAVRGDDRFIRDFACALWDAERHDLARETCGLVSEEHPGTEALLASLADLSSRGYIELSLHRLQACRQRRLIDETSMAAIRQLVFAAGAACQDHILSGRLERAHSICDSLIELCPAVELFRQLRLEINAARATAARERSDFETELQHRLAVWRDPMEAKQHSLFRTHNTSLALCHVLNVDADIHDPGRIQLARSLLEAMASIPITPASSDEGDSPVRWWERAQRLLFATIDLDRIITPLPEPLPPLWTRFISSSGHPLEPDAVAARARELDARVIFSTSADPQYFIRYIHNYLSSILEACDCNFMVAVCICAPVEQATGLIRNLGIDDRRLIFYSDGFDPEARPVTVYCQTERDPTDNLAGYYASAAIMRMDLLLRNLELPVLVTGIDTVLQRGVADLLDEFEQYAIVLNKCSPHFLLGGQIVNNLVLAYPKQDAITFIDFLKSYLGEHLAGPIQSNYLDQLDVHMAKHHLAACGKAAAIGYFGPFDINNVVFSSTNYRANIETMRKFRFLNMFVSALGPDARLRVEHVAEKAA